MKVGQVLLSHTTAPQPSAHQALQAPDAAPSTSKETTRMSALSNARWLILIQGYKIALQLVAMSVLTRLLPPSDYGLMAMAWTAANFASLIRDLGTSSAIIQKKELTERTKSTIFWLQMSLGMALCIGLIALSGVIANGFKQSALQPILCFLALTFPIGSLSAVHQALMERQSGFRALARIEIVASSVALLVAIVAAMQGAGVYSFVWQSLTSTLLYVIQSWLAFKWRPHLTWDREGIKQIFGYSGNLSAFNLINFMSRNADSMIIGRYLGAAALGSYSMAYKLMLFPLQNLTFVAGRALFPVMSRQQDSNADMAALYVRAVAMVAAIATPMMAGLYVLREPFTQFIFGGQWGDVAHVIGWLAPVGAMQAIISTTGAIYSAKGRTDILFRVGLLSAIVTVCSFYLGLSQGVVGVAMYYFLANLLMFGPQTYYVSYLIDLSYRKFWQSLLPPIVCSALMVPAVYFVFQKLASFGDIPALVAASVAGALVYFVGYFVLFRKGMMELLRVVLGSKLSGQNRAAPGAPASRRVWLFIDLATEFGGHEVMLLRWIDELKSAGTVDPVLVCQPDSRLAQQASSRCQVITLHNAGTGQGKLGKLKFLARLLMVLARAKRTLSPELAVVAEGGLFAQRFGLYAARLTRLYTVMYVPILASFESMDMPQGATLDKKVRGFYGKLPHAWLAITPSQATEFRAWSGVRQPIFTLPNTVQTAIEQRYAQGLGTRAANPDAPLHILVLGRLEHHQKGLDLLLAHIQGKPELTDRFVIHITGEGPYHDTLLRAKQQDAKLDRCLVLQPWGNPLDEFAKHDVVLIPSRYEGVPLVMLEAMAFGLPVLASDLAGTRDYLPSVCLFPVGQLDKAFDRLATLQRSPTRATRIARRNLSAFKAQASGGAFATAVQTLTLQLSQAASTR